MGKKIIVNERVLKHILMEMTKETTLINEAISVANAYAKFYSTKLTEEEYNAAVNGTTNMTPYHKALLDCMIAAKENNSYDWAMLGKACGEIWANADANIRQLLLKAVKSKELNPKDPNGFYKKSEEIARTKVATKAQVANNGLVTLYEDDKVLVTCTTTYSASHKFYADSHWCTASDIYGQYNGYCMFLNYTVNDNSCLVQIVPKENRDDMFQVQVGTNGTGQICNAQDDGVSYFDMISSLNANIPNIEEIVKNCLKTEKIAKLVEQTKTETEEDGKYWRPATEKRIAEIAEQLNGELDLSKYDSVIKDMVRRCIEYNERNRSEWDGDVAIRTYTSGKIDSPYFLLQYEIELESVLNSEAESWIWSCKRSFPSAEKISNKIFLCKMINNEGDFETVQEAENYTNSAFSVKGVIGYCNSYDTKGSTYTVINQKTGKTVFSNEYINYITEQYMILGKNGGPYKVFDNIKNKVVLGDVISYYLSWGDLYVKIPEAENSRYCNDRGHMRIDVALKYFGQ